MSSRRVIVCYDMKGGRVVKGVNFVALRDLGDPAELATGPATADADEIVFLDIDPASSDRAGFLDLVRNVAASTTTPITAGGGIRSLDDIELALAAGAQKVGISSAIVRDPSLLTRAALRFGSDRIIACIDARRVEAPAGQKEPYFEVFTGGGSSATGLEVTVWATECANRGAGGILLTSIDQDGRRDGFDLEMTDLVARAVPVPVTASGGAGSADDFVRLFKKTAAAAGLGASIFHDGTTTAAEVKARIRSAGIETSKMASTP